MPSAGLDELLVGFDPARYGRATPRFGRDELDRVNAALLQKMPFQAVEERLRALGLHDVAPGFWVAVRGNVATLAEAADWYRICREEIARDRKSTSLNSSH